MLQDGPPGCVPLIVVRQIRPGSRLRVPGWAKVFPLNSETEGARLFGICLEEPLVKTIEGVMRELEP